MAVECFGDDPVTNQRGQHQIIEMSTTATRQVYFFEKLANWDQHFQTMETQ